ncbi:MAG: prepilin-type N-terminal cleavage/methylation domain-containing protein [Thermodesulfovibrionales bacterium]|nr:prepilin-type N-terminal cleavage/methylation domain-containing protein [Thermodesulfovibrionales bacterium]
MRGLKNSKGFTLIELAIVLVIIGIILGAVLKGQDLIEGAKVKKIINFPNKWEIPIWAFYDKKGYFPGDTDTTKDGLINSFAALKTDLDNAKLSYPADTEADVTIEIKGLANVCGAGATVTRNVMLLTNVPADYAVQLDISQDGTADGTKGRVQYCGTAGTTTAAAWPTTGTVTVTYLFDKMY